MSRERIFITALLTAWFCAVPPAGAAEKHADAEVLLFETDHLRKINRPVTLRYSFKYYVFTLSDSLPGSVYQIRAVVPATDGGKRSLMEEALTFDRADEPTGKQ